MTREEILHDEVQNVLCSICELKRPKGEWILKERTAGCSTAIDIVCSECGYVGVEEYAYGYELNELSLQEIKDYIKKFDMNFCTCCGAKMDKGDI